MSKVVKRRGGRLLSVVLLLTIGGNTSKTTVVEASISPPLASKPTLLVSKSPSVSSLSSRTLSVERDATTSDCSDNIGAVVIAMNEKVVPRGGGDDESTTPLLLAQRLKVGGYFALWYILNIIYNSKLKSDSKRNETFPIIILHYMQN
jgi:hypothetical protein